jgi:hypothetical protein
MDMLDFNSIFIEFHSECGFIFEYVFRKKIK